MFELFEHIESNIVVCVSALGHRCGQLQTINLSYFDKVANAGISALGHGCSQLHTINLEAAGK